MSIISFIFRIYLVYIHFSFTYSQSVSSICGVPRIPCLSKISPIKTQYNEGDVVTYRCDNEYIDFSWTSICRKGEWNKTELICGKSNYNLIYSIFIKLIFLNYFNKYM